MDYKQYLRQGNYLTANKIVAKKIGLLESIFLSTLLDIYSYREKGGLVSDDGFFEASTEAVEEETTLTRDQQPRLLAKLLEYGLISIDRRGLPAKRVVKISDEFEIIMEGILTEVAVDKSEEKPSTSSSKSRRQCDGNAVDIITKTKSITKSNKQGKNVSNFDYENWVLENYTNQILIQKYLKYLKIRPGLKCKNDQEILEKHRREFEKIGDIDKIYELLDKAHERGWKGLEMEYVTKTNNQKNSAYIK
jgi:hypothetical protein